MRQKLQAELLDDGYRSGSPESLTQLQQWQSGKTEENNYINISNILPKPEDIAYGKVTIPSLYIIRYLFFLAAESSFQPLRSNL